MLHIRLMGAPRVLDGNGEELQDIVRSTKIVALLAYIAAPPGVGRRRDLITALLWPERDREHARHALRQLLSRLRSVVGPEALSCGHQETVVLDAEVARSDTTMLEEALAEDRLVEALALYRGPFLDGFHLSGSSEFEAWVEEMRHHYQRLALDAVDRLIARARKERAPRAERRWLERALEIDPYSEPRSERLVALLLDCGERGAALAERERLRHRLEDDLGLEPVVEPLPVRPPGVRASDSTAGPDPPAAGPLAAGEEVRRAEYHFLRWSAESIERALVHFSRAARIQPDAARAHAGQAMAYAILGHFGHLPPHVAFPRAGAAAARALDLDEEAIEALLVLGMKAHLYDRDIGTGLGYLHQAREAAPEHPFPHWGLGLVHASLEEHDDARESMRRARLLAPLSLPVTTGEAWVHIGARDVEEAERHVWNTLELDPEAPQAIWQLGIVRELQGNPADGARHFRHAHDRSPSDALILASLGHALARAGDDVGSARILRRLLDSSEQGRYVPPLAPAMVHAGRDEVEHARTWLERAVAERDGLIAFLAPWPFTRNLRGEPWFEALLQSLFSETAGR